VQRSRSCSNKASATFVGLARAPNVGARSAVWRSDCGDRTKASRLLDDLELGDDSRTTA
jgi:hypothetical protein